MTRAPAIGINLKECKNSKHHDAALAAITISPAAAVAPCATTTQGIELPSYTADLTFKMEYFIFLLNIEAT